MIKKNIAYILASCLIGFIFCLWILQKNNQLQRLVSKHLIRALEKEWQAKIKLKASHLNLLTQSVILTQGRIHSHKKNCWWSFDYCKATFSIFDLLINKQVSLNVTFYNSKCQTGMINNTPGIIDHLQDIFNTKEDLIKIRPTSITIHNGQITIEQKRSNLSSNFVGTLTINKNKKSNTWDGCLNCKNSSLSINNMCLIDNWYGYNTFKIAEQQQTTWDGTNNFVLKNHSPCTLHIHNKAISLTNADKKINLEVIYKNIITVNGSLPFAICETLYKAIAEKQIASHADQTQCNIDLKINPKKQLVKGNFSIAGNNIVPHLACNNIILTQHKITADLEAKLYHQGFIQGKVNGNPSTQSININFYNKTKLVNPTQPKSWKIDPHKAKLTMHIGPKKINGSFSTLLKHQLSLEKKALVSHFYYKNDALFLKGKTTDGTFSLLLKLFPTPHICKIMHKQHNVRQANVHLACSKDSSLTLKGYINVPFILSFLNHDQQHAVLGANSALYLHINQNQLPKIMGKFSIHKGTLYIPETHNIIKEAKAAFSYEPKKNKCILKNIAVNMHKGNIICPQATITHNPDLTLDTMHIPIEINDVFINWKKDLYAYAYGSILLNKKNKQPINISGHVCLQKSLLQNNIFSNTSDSQLAMSTHSAALVQENLILDLNIFTEQPMRVKIPTLDSQASINLQIKYNHHKNEFNFPQIGGAISLNKGSLQFLKHSLFIEYGKIQFLPHQINDAMIDLVAKNRINKYYITLHATGSLKKPNIILESVPELEEEQILNLLLTGSEFTSLQKDLPAIVLQNLTTILDANQQLPKKTTSFLATLARPFKYVQITPNFTDQSGRGGIKGTLSIDLNKQLHAQLQKNFSLQEDFSFQMQYLVSDDINIKAIKDQRGELGTEVEVRFKL